MYPTPNSRVELDYNLPPFQYCRSYLNSPLSVYKINPQTKDTFISALNMMENCSCSLDKDNKIPDDFNYGVIELGLNTLTQLTFEIKNEKYFDKFIYDYSFLAHNINMNTLKHDVIKTKCAYLERFSKKGLNLTDTIVMFNAITEKLSKWKTYVPPSFKLSDHYLRVIKEE